VTDIEFLDPGPAAGTDPEHPDAGERAAPDLRRWLPAIGAAVGWLGAAGFAVMASVGVVYRLVYRGSGQTQSVAVDAWGRFDKPQLASDLGHGTRYAIVLVAAAVVLLAAALVGVVRVPVARYLGLAGAAATIAMAGTLYLYVDSTRSTYAARDRQLAGQTDTASAFSLHVQTGSAIWLAAIAALLALAGTVCALFVTQAPAAALAAAQADAHDGRFDDEGRFDDSRFDDSRFDDSTGPDLAARPPETPVPNTAARAEDARPAD